MRAIAFLLLGLLALSGARPACAMADPAPMTMTNAQDGCAGMERHGDRHACVTAPCLGCALPSARATFPTPAFLTQLAPPIAVAVARLVGLGPRAAIPPPRSLA